MTHIRATSTRLVDRGLLAIGFVALAGAILTAHFSPATAYELSLYAGTPLIFWFNFGIAMLVSLLVALRTTVSWLRRLALLLGGAATTAFVGLPVLRGYHFFSGGDALTHLGWARGLESGTIQPTELLYPALHTVTTLFDVTFQISDTHAMMLVVVVLAALFYIFVTLSATLVSETRYTSTAAAFSAFLFLPITTVATHMLPHAMSQAIMVSSLVLFLLLKYVSRPESPQALSAVGVALGISSVGLVLYHPQLAAHMLAVFLGISILQYLFRRSDADHPIASHRPLYAQTVILTVAFLVWISNHEVFVRVVEFTISRTVSYFVADGTAAESVASQGASLADVGGSIAVIFLKLFGVSLLYLILIGLWMLWRREEALTQKASATVLYFVIGLVGLGGIFGLYFFGSVSEMYFRVFGLMMVFITVLGAVAIADGTSKLSSSYSESTVHSVVAVVFVIALVVSLLAVFPSPYVYRPSPHITETTTSGHYTAFEYEQEELEYVGIRAGPSRYKDAWSAQLEKTDGQGVITGAEIERGIADQFTEDRYLTMTQSDREREVHAYRELRYTQSQLNSIPTQPDVNRVHSNGGFELFYINADAE